jgi:hypothetical protein
MARPRKDIDRKDFESLLALQCTLEEVTAFFDHKLDGCSADTIERWCKRTYKENFADIAAKKRNLGKISLRRAQFELAKKNGAVAIFLGKNYLGQTDKIISETAEDNNGQLAELIDGLRNNVYAETTTTNGSLADKPIKED